MSTVLIVEDDFVQSEGLRYILEDAGHEVVVVADGEAALKRLTEISVDLILSDVVMPGLSGYDLCKKVKAEHKNVPVILVTVLSDLKDLISGLTCGADNFLTKPYEPEELLTQIQKVVDSQSKPGGPICDPTTGVCLIDNKFMMNLDRRRILDWLVSTFDEFLKAREKHSEAKLEERRRMLEEREKRLTAIVTGVISKLECSEQTLTSVLARNELAREQQSDLERAQRECREALECVRKEKDAALV